MTARDAAAATLSGISTAYRIVDAGEYPPGSAYREAGRFYCAIDAKAGGRIYLGQAGTPEAAVRRAVNIAKGVWP